MMKKYFTIAMAVMLSCMTAFAQSLTEGFYRVQNYGSGRYAYVRDSKGDVSTLGADMAAIELWPNLDAAISDPGSVIYLKKVGSQYDLQSQGTGVYQLTGSYMSLFYDGTYTQVYASGQYLYEIGVSDIYPDMGIIGAKTAGEMPGKTQYKLWKTPLVDSNTDNYFGFKPTVQAGGKYYTPFYADFGFTPKAGTKVWYVSQVDKQHAIAVIKQITGTVASKQPVFIECAGATPASNKVDLTAAAGNTATGNQLKGVFFDNGDRSALDHTGLEPPVTIFDSQTMRVLDVDSQGKLAFVNASDKSLTTLRKVYINGKWNRTGVKAIPHNQAYLSVEADCPATLTVMTEAEYQDYLATLVSEVGKADIAYDIQVAAPTAESGKDIPACGGRDRAVAKVTYKYLTRTFMSDGTYTDGAATSHEMTLFGDYTAEQPSLGAVAKPRTKVGSSQPKGLLQDKEGNTLKVSTTVYAQLADCEASAESLDIYQEANEITGGEVMLQILSATVQVGDEGAVIALDTLATASQLLSFTSGDTRDGEVTLTYESKEAREGFDLQDGLLTVTPNTTTEARQGYSVLVYAEGEGGYTASGEIAFTQAAKPAGIAGLHADSANQSPVYDLSGKQVRSSSLNRGVYISNKRKYINR